VGQEISSWQHLTNKNALFTIFNGRKLLERENKMWKKQKKSGEKNASRGHF
jgi:hypothetical protein